MIVNQKHTGAPGEKTQHVFQGAACKRSPRRLRPRQAWQGLHGHIANIPAGRDSCLLFGSFMEDRERRPPVVNISNFEESSNIDVVIVCSDYVSEITVRLRDAKLYPHDRIKTYSADWFTTPLTTEERQFAMSLFRRMRKESPDKPFVYDALGRLAVMHGDLAKALHYFGEAKALFPHEGWGEFGIRRLSQANRHV